MSWLFLLQETNNLTQIGLHNKCIFTACMVGYFFQIWSQFANWAIANQYKLYIKCSFHNMTLAYFHREVHVYDSSPWKVINFSKRHDQYNKAEEILPEFLS